MQTVAQPVVDLLVLPRYLVPIEPSGCVLEDHALVVHAGRIVDLLPAADALQRYQPRQTRQLAQHAVLPGLVNAHTHAAMSLLRGFGDDMPLMDWLQTRIWPAEAAHVNAAFCADGVRLAFAEMIRSGTTCANDMYFFPDATAQVARECGLRASLGLIVLDFPTAWARNADEYLHKGLELHDSLRGEALITTLLAPHAPYTVSDAPLLRIREYANELGIGIHMHVHETRDEVMQAVQASGERPWARLARLGLLGADFLAVHMTQLDAAEVDQAARLGVHVAHCPESNLKLASGYCPVARLAKAGINLALGTDGAASNNDLDLFGEMRTAALLAKAVANDACALPAAQTLHAATLGGARALGLDAQIGSLTIGKSADFIAVDLLRPNTQPLYDVISQLVYAAGREQVTDVYVAGRELLREGTLTTLDETAILARAAEWRMRIGATQ